ncbi:MAG: hypothetical protein ABIZ81_02450 [Opitutaceae bacterium]
MRTTIDLPDPLFKEAKAAAALEGVTLRDVVEDALRRRLQPHARRSSSAARGRLGRKNGFLVLKCKGRQVINPTPAQLDEWL